LAQDTRARTAAQSGDQVSSFAAPENFWTPEKLKKAKPMPWYDEGADADASFAEDYGVSGPPTFVNGGLPGEAGASGEEIDIDMINQMESGSFDASADFGVDFGTKDIFDSDYVNYYSPLRYQYPYRAIGKLFFTNATGGSSSCTGSVISPNSIIVTAAHCCYDRTYKKWMTNWSFAPARFGTTNPYGLFGYYNARVLTAWITSGGRQNDVCLVHLKPNSAGKTVASQVGWLGRSWNYPITQHHFAFGYPGNIGSGSYNCECSAESLANCGSSLVYAMGCDMTYGASGGPWIRVFKKFSSGAKNYVNAVVSGWDGTCTGTFGKTFNGPRFTSSNIVVLCTAEGC
jgi:V8-like Glu-specific endopeptidase